MINEAFKIRSNTKNRRIIIALCIIVALSILGYIVSYIISYSMN